MNSGIISGSMIATCEGEDIEFFNRYEENARSNLKAEINLLASSE